MFARTIPVVSDRIQRELLTTPLIHYDAAPRNSLRADGINTKSVTMETFVNFLRVKPTSHREVIFETGGTGNVRLTVAWLEQSLSLTLSYMVLGLWTVLGEQASTGGCCLQHWLQHWCFWHCLS
jgi:hypothetical protein